MAAPSIGLLLSAAVAGVWTEPAAPRSGDLALLYVESRDASIDRAVVRVFDYEFDAFRVAPDRLRAVIAVPLERESGAYQALVIFPLRTEIASIMVARREFDRSDLKVSSQFTGPKPAALQARLKEEAKQMEALWRPDPTPPRFFGELKRPVDGAITGVFGTRRVFNGKRTSIHYGLDLDGKIGDPVRAVQAGRVVMSALRWASGGTIIVDHGSGVFTAYFHLSRRTRNVGDWLQAGDLIGAVGKTGRVTGPHLHLAVLVRARRIDPDGTRAEQARALFADPEPLLQLRFDGDPAFVRTAISDDVLGVGRLLDPFGGGAEPRGGETSTQGARRGGTSTARAASTRNEN